MKILIAFVLGFITLAVCQSTINVNFAGMLAGLGQLPATPSTPQGPRGDADYIIVGSGAGGTVLASRLAEGSPNSRILLIEAGVDDRQEPIIKDLNQWWLTYQAPKISWGFTSIVEPTLGNRTVLLANAKATGGNTVHNAAVFNRGDKFDFDSWAAGGATGWDTNSLLPHFKRLETWNSVKFSDNRGDAGELQVKEAEWSQWATDFTAEATKLGYPEVEDYNDLSKGTDGTGRVQLNAISGLRQHNFAKFIRNKNLTNIRVLTETTVLRVVFQGNKAVGVQVIDSANRTRTLTAEKEIVLSAGAFGTPKILMLSGIGHAQHLSSLGIPVVADLPVGDNLQDHPTLAHWYQANRTLPSVPGEWSSVQIIGNIPGETPNTQAANMHVVTVARKESLIGLLPPNFPDADKLYIIFGTLLHPRSRGTVRLSSSNPHDLPRINMNSLSVPSDIQQLKVIDDFVKTLGAAIAPKWGAVSVFEDPTVPFDTWARNTLFHAWHPVGTCKMGRVNDPTAVVTPDLKVKGIQNLRVVDASVMPTITSGNTAVPTMVIGSKAAELILRGPN